MAASLVVSPVRPARNPRNMYKKYVLTDTFYSQLATYTYYLLHVLRRTDAEAAL